MFQCNMHEGIVEGANEVPKKNLDQAKILQVQAEVVRSMGHDTDEKVMDFVVKHAADFRNLVNTDEEVQQALSDVDVPSVAKLVVKKLGLENQN